MKSVHSRTGTALLFAVAAMACLAADAEDAYIESTTADKQAINTGYYINARTKIEIDFQMTSIVSQGRLFGQDGDGCGNYAVVYFGWGNNANDFKFGYGNSFNGAFIAANNLRRNTIIYDGPNNKGYMLQDGNVVATVDLTAAHGNTANFPCGIFANTTDAAGSFNNFAPMRLYGFKVYEDGELVRDLSPALKGGRAGLYDRVRGTFHANNNALANFAYGGDIMEIPDDGYVQSDGTVGVNSRYFFNPKSRIEVDYALTDTTTGQQRIWGRDSSAPKAALYVQGSLNIALASGDDFVNSDTQTGLKADTARHTVILDVNDKTAAFVTGGTTNWSKSAILDTHAPSTTATIPIGIFACMEDNASGMSYNNFAKAKIYRIKFFTDGELIYDYVPCVQGGIAGFKDMVNGAFITSETAGELTYGGNILVEAGPGYLANNGKAFIDTDYTVTPHTRVEVDYLHVQNLKDNRVFSAYDTDSLYFLHYSNGGTNYAWCCMDDSGNWTSTGLPIHKFRRRTFIIDPHADFAGLVTAGYTNYSSTISGVATALGGTYVKNAGRPLRVFADNSGSLVSDLRLYGLRIYEAGTLVSDFIPYSMNGEAGLYDQKAGAFKTSANKYALTAGGEIASNGRNDAYLESDATQGINTGYLMKGSQSRIECDFAFPDATGTQQRPFGQDAGGDLVYSLYVNWEGKFVYGFGNTFINSHGPYEATDTRRHTAIIDGYHNRLYWVTGGVTNKTYDISGDAHNNNATWPLGIFATPNNQSATEWRNPSKMKLYSFRIYENDVLVHEYLPYNDNGVPCLYDTVDGIARTDVRNGNAFVLGGMGVDGAEKWVKELPATRRVSQSRQTIALTAAAAGAVRYRWTLNGEEIEGATGETCTAMWRKGHYDTPDIYTCTAIYDVFGTETEGAPVTCEVTNLPFAFVLVVR